MLRAAGTCVTGPAHLDAGQLGQDALSLRGWQGGWVAAVADGLGSKPLSARGSRLAVQAAQTSLRQRVAGAKSEGREMAVDIYRRWLHQRPGGAKPADAATTLLLAACDASGHVCTWQIGDGLIVVRSGGQLQVLTPERSGFGNQTQALGVGKRWSAWNTHRAHLHQPGDLVALMTDGIADDLSSSALPGFVAALHRQLCQRSRRQGRRWLTHELAHWATPGHSDDKTLAVIFKE